MKCPPKIAFGGHFCGSIIMLSCETPYQVTTSGASVKEQNVAAASLI